MVRCSRSVDAAVRGFELEFGTKRPYDSDYDVLLRQ
jgi:hypothetical protein